MANIIIVLILVALVGYGIYSYVHHLTHGGGCWCVPPVPAARLRPVTTPVAL